MTSKFGDMEKVISELKFWRVDIVPKIPWHSEGVSFKQKRFDLPQISERGRHMINVVVLKIKNCQKL